MTILFVSPLPSLSGLLHAGVTLYLHQEMLLRMFFPRLSIERVRQFNRRFKMTGSRNAFRCIIIY